MRPLTYALPLLSALAAIAAPSPNLEARQVQPNQHGTIITFFFGSFLEPNFGLPPLSGNPPPPSTLTLPTVDGVVSGGKLYLAVVETANTCPPRNVPPQYALTKTSLVLQ